MKERFIAYLGIHIRRYILRKIFQYISNLSDLKYIVIYELITYFILFIHIYLKSLVCKQLLVYLLK